MSRARSKVSYFFKCCVSENPDTPVRKDSIVQFESIQLPAEPSVVDPSKPEGWPQLELADQKTPDSPPPKKQHPEPKFFTFSQKHINLSNSIPQREIKCPRNMQTIKLKLPQEIKTQLRKRSS